MTVQGHENPQPRSWMLPVALGLAVAVIQFLALAPTYPVHLETLQDEGSPLVEADRMASGALPYRDFFLRFMPGTPALVSVWFRLWGTSIGVARVHGLVVLILLTVAIQFASWRLFSALRNRPTDSRWRTAAWSLFPTVLFMCVGGQVWPLVSWHWDSNLLAMLALLAVVGPATSPSEAGAARRSRTLALVGGGILAGLAGLVLQTKGAAAVGGLLAFLLVLRRPWRQRIAEAAMFLVGVAIPCVLFVGFLLAHSSWGSFLDQTVRFNLGEYRAHHSQAFNLDMLRDDAAVVTQGLGQLGRVPFSAWLPWFASAFTYLAVEIVTFAAYFPILALGVVVSLWTLWRQPQDHAARVATAACLLAAVAAFFDATRPNRYHLNFQTPFWHLILAYLLYRLADAARENRLGLRASVSCTGLLLAVFLVHGCFNVHDWSRFRYPVAYPRGTLYCSTPQEAALRSTVGQVVELSLAGRTPASLFVFPYAPLEMFLLGRPNPVRYAEAIPTEYTLTQVRSMRADLDRANSPLVVFYPIDPVTAQRSYPGVTVDDLAGAQEQFRRILTDGYDLVFDGGAARVYARPGATNPLRRVDGRP